MRAFKRIQDHQKRQSVHLEIWFNEVGPSQDYCLRDGRKCPSEMTNSRVFSKNCNDRKYPSAMANSGMFSKHDSSKSLHVLLLLPVRLNRFISFRTELRRARAPTRRTRTARRRCCPASCIHYRPAGRRENGELKRTEQDRMPF